MNPCSCGSKRTVIISGVLECRYCGAALAVVDHDAAMNPTESVVHSVDLESCDDSFVRFPRRT